MPQLGMCLFLIVRNGTVLELSFRKADEADLPALVSLFVDDPLGAQRDCNRKRGEARGNYSADLLSQSNA